MNYNVNYFFITIDGYQGLDDYDEGDFDEGGNKWYNINSLDIYYEIKK